MAIIQEVEIKLEGGVVATLGGRYTFKDSNNVEQHVYLYYTEKDQSYRSNDPTTAVLTPTANWTHDLGDGPWQRYHKQGTKQIVLSKDTWLEIKQADEVDNFDPQTYTMVSNKTQKVVETIEKQIDKNSKSDKKLDKISEKVVQKMSENTNSTLDMFKDASIDALKMVGANQANELIVSGLKKALMSMGFTHEWIESEAGHKLLKTMGPLVIHYVASTQSDFIDNLAGENASENIMEGCKFAVQAAMGEIMQHALVHIKPLLTDLASLGANAAKNAFKAPIGAVDETDGVAELLKQKTKSKA